MITKTVWFVLLVDYSTLKIYMVFLFIRYIARSDLRGSHMVMDPSLLVGRVMTGISWELSLKFGHGRV